MFDEIETNKIHVTRSRTFFKAPTTGNYNLIASSKYNALVLLHKTADVIPSNFANSDLKLEVSGNQFREPFLQYRNSKFSTISDPVSLEENKYYYMEIWTQRKGNNNGHTSVGFISD